LGFSLFAGVSALATAWGRSAIDVYGVSNANASRYTIFGVYLLLGQIYYVAAGLTGGWLILQNRVVAIPIHYICMWNIPVYSSEWCQLCKSHPVYMNYHK
jgi:hypothetical protein